MGRIVALLAAVLILANAYCFVRCDLDASSRGVPPCHSQTKIVADHCIEQHDSTVAIGGSWTCAAAVLPCAPSSTAMLTPARFSRLDTSPPASISLIASAPLRI